MRVRARGIKDIYRMMCLGEASSSPNGTLSWVVPTGSHRERALGAWLTFSLPALDTSRIRGTPSLLWTELPLTVVSRARACVHVWSGRLERWIGNRVSRERSRGRGHRDFS